MPNTYTQIHIHAIFAVQNRLSLITKSWQNQLYMYITGIIQNHGHKLLVINGMPDHVHIFFGMRPTESLSDLMRDIKGDSSRWINENRLVAGKFCWQEGFGAFSYARSQTHAVINYIENQEKHHSRKSFKQEYSQILKSFEVEFDERFIFKDVED